MRRPIRKKGSGFDVGTKAEEFLNSYSNPSSRNKMKSGIIAFCDSNGITDLDHYLEQACNKNHILADVQNMVKWCLAPYTDSDGMTHDAYKKTTISGYLTACKQLFAYHDLDFTAKDLRKLKTFLRRSRMTKGVSAIPDDKILSRKQLQTVISSLPLHTKAFCLMMVSGGIRPVELLALTNDDVFFDESPARIEISEEASKGDYAPRFTFISDEARSALQAWLNAKPNWKKRVSKNHGQRFDNDLIFGGMSSNNIRTIWNNALKRHGYDERRRSNNQYIYHLYTLRKFFRSRSRLDVDVRDWMMGHKRAHDGSYLRLDVNETATEYLQSMDDLTVYPVDHRKMTSLEEQTTAQQKEIEALKEQMAELRELLSTATEFTWELNSKKKTA